MKANRGAKGRGIMNALKGEEDKTGETKTDRKEGTQEEMPGAQGIKARHFFAAAFLHRLSALTFCGQCKRVS